MPLFSAAISDRPTGSHDMRPLPIRKVSRLRCRRAKTDPIAASASK